MTRLKAGWQEAPGTHRVVTQVLLKFGDAAPIQVGVPPAGESAEEWIDHALVLVGHRRVSPWNYDQQPEFRGHPGSEQIVEVTADVELVL